MGAPRLRHILALAALVSASWAPGAAAQVAPAAQPMQTVRVPFVRDPVDKSYRKMIRGMDRFARDRALAPQATLRFRLLPRLPNSQLEGVTLRVLGDNVSLPLTIAPDFSFVLPRNSQAFNEDAAVIASRRSDSMTWRAWVQSPGLAPGTRRLGDLRLECLVGMESGLVSNSSPMFGWLSNMLTDPDQVCGQPDGNYLFFADRPLFSVILRHGSRTQVLPFDMLYAGGQQTREMLPFCDCQVLLDRSYYAPIWDRSWPDDTVVAFEYMTDAAVQP
ncbi:hypothetical protein KY495_05630 [Massilia sp. PAMC28688]|nr:hypothetical protein KY495_05630 [Massilia sp. PAMC28688]